MITEKWLYERITRRGKTTRSRLADAGPVRPIMLADGEEISVQAGEWLYCTPRENKADWATVECGFPSFHPSPALMQYCDDPEKPTETVYGYVPIEIVLAEIEAHGGVHPDDSKE